jgi:hypothetical protein
MDYCREDNIMRSAILIWAILLLIGLTSFVQAGSDVRSPDYWRESPNRWRGSQWRQSPENRRNEAYRQDNQKYRRTPQNWRNAPYKWDKQKWSKDPSNWRNKAYRFNKQKWQQSPLNWQNSPYRWRNSDERSDGGIDIQMDFEGRTKPGTAESTPQATTDTPEGLDEIVARPIDEQPKGPRVLEIGRGSTGTHRKYSGRVLPVIRIHGTAPTEAPHGGRPAAERSTRAKQLDGFAVYGLER